MGFEKTVTLPSGDPYTVKTLLAMESSNTKLLKRNGRGEEFLIASLSLAPGSISGVNLCASASPGCLNSCIFTSGRARVHPRTILPARIAKSVFLNTDPQHFYDRLCTEIRNANRKAKRIGKSLAVRLNVFSDVMWERKFPEIFTKFPDVQFYDYTKHFNRMLGYLKRDFPANYDLTFSRSEINENKCVEVLSGGGRIAMPFSKKLPDLFWGHWVVNGDVDDLRFLDPHRVIVGLSAKGAGKKDTTGFIQEGV